ncbi:class I SAM-dependent methyltransferase [Saliterribacillus persicus]|uniref:Methyltransferase family protein n=1 Tax=Saliterribacillus persicus TaxID=930114 RepID=A0A368XVL6_9BACI|nr:class I SAM-dependent methyltransferase [Saliterribacillus persicus]RCW71992.1 methyltransferase family protein [Saliterribacillus persicus]
MLEDTGERIIPEKMKITNESLIEHIARYHFAAPYMKGKVLDFACGSGYGTHIIAKKCKKEIDEIIGVDIDKDAITYAKSNYYHPLSSFLQENVLDEKLSSKLGKFDVILSFETIEHIEEEDLFLQNIFNLLKTGGILILSTPFGKGRGIKSGQPFHVHQLKVEEFTSMFHEYKDRTFYYQKGALIEPADHAKDDHYPLGIVVARK